MSTQSMLPKSRRGAAMIEFALSLPIFFMITMGTIEACRLIYLRQSLKIAAYECARIGITPEASKEQLQDQCDVLLLGRKIDGYTMTVIPDDLSSLEFGDALNVTIEISSPQNAIMGTWFYPHETFSESVTLMAEY